MFRKLALLVAGLAGAALLAAPAAHAASYTLCTEGGVVCIQDAGSGHFLKQAGPNAGNITWGLASDGRTYLGNPTYQIRSNLGNCMSAVYGTYAVSAACGDLASERFWIGSTNHGTQSLIASVGVTMSAGVSNCVNASQNGNGEWNNVACPGGGSAAFDIVVT